MEPDVNWIIVFRGIAIAEMLLLLGLLLKRKEQSIALRLSQLFVACVVCYLVSEAYRPDFIDQRPPFIWYALVGPAMAIPALFWGLARAVFLDGFEWGKKEWWVFGVYEFTAVAFLGADYYWKFELGNRHAGFMMFPVLMQIGLALWTLYIIIESWRVDLMERRRRLRLIAALIIASYTLFTLMFELTGVNTEREASTLLIHHIAIALLGFITLLWLGQISVDHLYSLAIDAEPTTGETQAETREGEPPASREMIADWETHLDHIRNERLYALENMTIAKLAELLSVPEYRLRKQIVQTTRFKNFNQFLNHFRIEEAARRLVSEKEHQVPILTVALDVGFRSLPSFNRSFREHYQMTPSEYRKSALIRQTVN
ncbi:MAG: helix-turn-helix transcriptional regulator [Ketobacteraceae bacterium]|nr:helix-turn-helix transcriptional regulator [Ketobacteraceae bacterium]